VPVSLRQAASKALRLGQGGWVTRGSHRLHRRF